MGVGWFVALVGLVLVIGCYLANAFRRIVEIEKRIDDLEGKKK